MLKFKVIKNMQMERDEFLLDIYELDLNPFPKFDTLFVSICVIRIRAKRNGGLTAHVVHTRIGKKSV